MFWETNLFLLDINYSQKYITWLKCYDTELEGNVGQKYIIFSVFNHKQITDWRIKIIQRKYILFVIKKIYPQWKKLELRFEYKLTSTIT